jgi:signal transduction histidine kinase
MTDLFNDDPFPEDDDVFGHIPIESRKLLARKYLETSEQLLLSLVEPNEKVGLADKMNQIRSLIEDEDASIFLPESEEENQILISELRKTELFRDQPEHELSLLATQLEKIEPEISERYFLPYEDKKGVYIVDGTLVISGMDCFATIESSGEDDELSKCITGDDIDSISITPSENSYSFYIPGHKFVELINLLPSCAQAIIQCLMGDIREALDGLKKERIGLLEQLRLTRDILENMGIGLLCLNQAGEIGQYYNGLVEEYLHRKDLAGVPFADMVFRKDRDSLRKYYRALQMLFSGNRFDPEMVIGMLPNEIVINQRAIQLDYFFVQDRQGHVLSLFVRLEDLTLERSTARQEQQEKKIIDAMHGNIGGYFQMLEDIKQIFDSVGSLFKDVFEHENQAGTETVAGIMRSLHSAKGLCGQYELDRLKTSIHEMETAVQQMAKPGMEDGKDLFQPVLRSFKKEFQYAVSIKESLGAGIIQILEGITFSPLEFEQLRESVENGNHVETRKLIIDKTLVPAERIIDNWSKDIDSMAEKCGKKIDFQADISEDLKIRKTLAHMLNVELGHLYRNSIDHGVELPQLRKEGGKHETGTVRISIHKKEGGLELIVKDDGCGLDIEKVIQVARDNPSLNQQEVDQFISTDQIWRILFLKGFSSKKSVTQISGRGVGLDSVKDALADIGGSIHMVSEKGAGSTFTVRIPLK